MLSESQAVFLHSRLGFMKSLTRKERRLAQEPLGEERIKSAPSPSSSCCCHRKWQAKPFCILPYCLWSDRDGSSGQRSLYFCKGSPTSKWQDANTDVTSVSSPKLCYFWLDKNLSSFVSLFHWSIHLTWERPLTLTPLHTHNRRAHQPARGSTCYPVTPAHFQVCPKRHQPVKGLPGWVHLGYSANHHKLDLQQRNLLSSV